MLAEGVTLDVAGAGKGGMAIPELQDLLRNNVNREDPGSAAAGTSVVARL